MQVTNKPGLTTSFVCLVEGAVLGQVTPSVSSAEDSETNKLKYSQWPESRYTE